MKPNTQPEKDKPQALVPVHPEERLPATTDPLSTYLREIAKFPVLTREEEAEIALYYAKHHDKESAQKLVVANLRLVVKIAMEYQRAFQNLLDLIQEGNTGLLRAVAKYDISKGTRFSYYASWWIRAYILKYLVDNFRLVKLGTTQAQKKLFFNLMKEKRKMEAMGFTPQTHLLSEKLDVKEKDIVQMEQRMGSADLSLDAPQAGFEGKTNLESLPDDKATPDDKAEADELKKILFQNLDEFVGILNEKEKSIFTKRMYAEVPKTLQEIADQYGITRERIRQIEERVVVKLKKFFSEKGLKAEISKKEE